MITGINLEQTKDYISKKDKENPTIWKLGIIPSSVMGILASSAKDDTGKIELAFKIVQYGVKGWTNFEGIDFIQEGKGINGIPILSTKLIDRIPMEIITELAEEILKVNKLGESEAKN